MSDLKNAILDAKYIDMIALGDFVVRDCGLPDMDSDGNLLPQANEIAAAIFRWAADVQAETREAAEQDTAAETTRTEAQDAAPVQQNDQFGSSDMGTDTTGGFVQGQPVETQGSM
jgi:hypothetical protein